MVYLPELIYKAGGTRSSQKGIAFDKQCIGPILAADTAAANPAGPPPTTATSTFLYYRDLTGSLANKVALFADIDFSKMCMFIVILELSVASEKSGDGEKHVLRPSSIAEYLFFLGFLILQEKHRSLSQECLLKELDLQIPWRDAVSGGERCRCSGSFTRGHAGRLVPDSSEGQMVVEMHLPATRRLSIFWERDFDMEYHTGW